MATLGKSSGKWTHTISSAGTLTIPTSGKYVDKNIEIITPEAKGSVTMTAGNGSVTGANCVLSSTDLSGITVTGKGSVSATAKITQAGYTPTTNSFATGSSTSSSGSTQYLEQVTLNTGKKLGFQNDIMDTMTIKYASDTNSIDFIFD